MMADEKKQESENETKWNFGQIWCRDIKPKFKNLKQEALNNSFSKLSKDKWNSILSKSRHIIDCKVGSPQSIRYSKLLRENNVTLKHVIAVKLYTDDDKLQREFRKCFISKHQSDIDHKQRLSEFYHWYKLLKIAFAAFSKVQYKNGHEILYHGVKCKSIINNQDGTYHGPLSTTTDIGVAREFAGNQGMILIIKPNKSDYNPINTEFLSDYPHEKEILLFNHNIHIQDYIRSIDYDKHYSIPQINEQKTSAEHHQIQNINVSPSPSPGPPSSIYSNINMQAHSNPNQNLNMNNMNNMNNINNANVNNQPLFVSQTSEEQFDLIAAVE